MKVTNYENHQIISKPRHNYVTFGGVQYHFDSMRKAKSFINNL